MTSDQSLDERDPAWDTAVSADASAEVKLAAAVIVQAIRDAIGHSTFLTHVERLDAWKFLFQNDDDLSFWLHQAQIDATPAEFRDLLHRKYGAQLRLRRTPTMPTAPEKNLAAEAKVIRDLLSTGPATMTELAVCSDIPHDTVKYVLRSLVILEQVKRGRNNVYRLAPAQP